MQSVMLQGTVYVGGGDAGHGNVYIIMVYDTSSEKWAELPPYRACDFAMTVINNQLVLVGGWEPCEVVPGKVPKIKVVGVWRPDSKEWTHPYPDMPTSRAYCSAVAYKEWLVVAGGEGDDGTYLSSVEVLNTDTKQWSAGPPTPAPWSCMRPAIVGDVCYFMGGYTDDNSKVYSVSLPALTSQLNSGVRHSKMWKEISLSLQIMYPSPLSISRSLLAVGGARDDRPVAGIYLYRPDTREWAKVGDLPTPRLGCSCIMVTDRELLVAGGWYDGMLKRVDIVQVD